WAGARVRACAPGTDVDTGWTCGAGSSGQRGWIAGSEEGMMATKVKSTRKQRNAAAERKPVPKSAQPSMPLVRVSDALRKEIGEIDRKIAHANEVAARERAAAKAKAVELARGDESARKAASGHEAVASKWTVEARRLADAKSAIEAELETA